MIRIRVIFLLFLLSGRCWAATLADLDSAVSKAQWDEAAEMADEILIRDPGSSEAKLKGAYALFQKGYTNGGLLFLKKLKQDEWKRLPQGPDRFVEIMTLFEKKVPLNFLPWRLEEMNEEQTSSLMADELRFRKGRQAYDRRDSNAATKYLQMVSKDSRFFPFAHYLLGSLAAEKGDFNDASKEFSSVFQPMVLSETTEFWNDVGSQVTSHWGANFKILLTSEPLLRFQAIAELSTIAMARVEFAKKNYETALKYYGQIPNTSPHYSAVMLEKIWTLWAMNRHAEAEKLGTELSLNEASFHFVQAHLVKAMISVDSGDTGRARQELASFEKAYASAKTSLSEYRQRLDDSLLPPFAKTALNQDQRLQAIIDNQAKIQKEIENLRAEDQKLFPVYMKLAGELEAWRTASHEDIERIKKEQADRVLADLDKLALQSKLILAETYLEDREKLKVTYNGLKNLTEAVQREHDEKLVDLLTKAVNSVEEPMAKLATHRVRLEFRQSELLWELGTARLILEQATRDKNYSEAGQAHQRQALGLIQKILREDPRFEKTDQVIFFEGFAQLELGQLNEGTKTLINYVQRFPTADHVADAYRILADQEFEKDRFKQAENYYSNVLAFPDSPLVGYALYKLGWCAYNEHAYARAILGLEKAILWASDPGQNHQLLGLEKESRHDLISIYAEVGDQRKALEYFPRFEPAGWGTWMQELTQQYENNGQYEKAQDMYRALILRDRGNPENLNYQAGIVQAAYKLQKWDLALENFRQFVSGYASIFADSKRDERAMRAEKLLREVTEAQLFDFKKSDTPETVSRVIEMDRLYLRAFKGWPESQEVLYRHAQYLLEKKHLEEAAAAFREHWIQFHSNLKEPLKEEALRNLIHTYASLEDLHKEEGKIQTPEAQEIVTASGEYEKLYPENKYVRRISFLRASTLIKYGLLEEGIGISQKLYDADSQDEIGKQSFKNLSHAYYALKDWKRTYEWAQSLKRGEPEAKTIRQESMFLWADSARDDVQSAQLFLKIVDNPEMTDLWEKSLYNAFIHFQKAGKKVDALEAADRLEKINPRDSRLRQIAGIRAAHYQEAGDYARALPLLEVFLENADKSVPIDALQQARLNSALILEALGNKEKAKSHYQLYLSKKEGTTPAGRTEAEAALKRMTGKNADRSPAAYKPWSELMKERQTFEKQPMPRGADLVQRLTKGASRLEQVTKKFLDVASKADTPSSYAVESYCAIPFLYASYSGAVRKLAGQDKEVAAELEKVASPLDEKVQEFVRGCIDRANASEHEGPVFLEIVNKWGWGKDPEIKKRTLTLLKELQNGGPWLEPAHPTTGETEILMNHLKGLSQRDDWYGLARLRFEKKQYGLSRLTFVDALAKDPNSGILLNGYTCVEQALGVKEGLIPLFEKAGALGSSFAFVNLAIVHLEAGRLEPALQALQKAELGGAFNRAPEIKKLMTEYAQK